MSKNMKTASIVGIILIAIVGYFAYDFVLGDTEEASEPISAIPLETDNDETNEESPTAEPVATDVPATEEAMAEEPTAEPEPTDEPEPTAEPVAAEPVVYEIVQDESEVRFELDEDLRGSRITVVGSTNQVAAQLSFALGDLSTAQVGVLQVNARTLVTDNDFRNRAIRNVILETDAYEFITFTPTGIEGLPENAGISDEITFQITGDLTIRDTTTTVTFDVTATPTSESELIGTATTIVLLDDYGLTIPEVPSVANVEDEVELIIDFVARATE